jgi:hypothetical protein
MKTMVLLALVLAACGAGNQAQRGESGGEYMAATGPGREGAEMRIDQNGRIFGANFDLAVTATGYQGILAGALTEMSSDDGERVRGSRDGRPIDMHFTFDGVTIRATGLFAGHLGRLEIDGTAISSSVGRCSFALTRREGLHYSGQRGCADGSIAPAALDLPVMFVRLPIPRKVMLLAALLYI